MLLFLEGALDPTREPKGEYWLCQLFRLQLDANEKPSSFSLCFGSTGPLYLGFGRVSLGVYTLLEVVLVFFKLAPSDTLPDRPRALLTRSRNGISTQPWRV